MKNDNQSTCSIEINDNVVVTIGDKAYLAGGVVVVDEIQDKPTTPHGELVGDIGRREISGTFTFEIPWWMRIKLWLWRRGLKGIIKRRGR